MCGAVLTYLGRPSISSPMWQRTSAPPASWRLCCSIKAWISGMHPLHHNNSPGFVRAANHYIAVQAKHGRWRVALWYDAAASVDDITQGSNSARAAILITIAQVSSMPVCCGTCWTARALRRTRTGSCMRHTSSRLNPSRRCCGCCVRWDGQPRSTTSRTATQC